MYGGGSWDDLINEAEAERFVGREQELDLFRREISLPRPRSIIFYITGQGGVGKSTLLGRYREMAQAAGFLLADTDELQRDVPSVLGRFAQQLAVQGIQLKRFNERYKTYRQKMDEIESDPQAPQGLAALLGRTVVRASYVVGDLVPGLRRGLEYIPRESVETQASEWAEYIARKITDKDDVALIRDPTPLLTSLFFEELNERAQKHRFLLCFENFEATRQDLQTWLLRLREYRPSLNITLMIAGRNPPGAQWDVLRKVTCVVHLDTFTEQEAEAFLDTYGITDRKRREDIIAYSHRLPVLMSWLAAPEGGTTEAAVPTHDIVERFLRWITDPVLRQVALVSAIPRTFNRDLLTGLVSQKDQPVDIQAIFEWLQTMPFVQAHAQGWRYHDVVRRMLLHYQRQTSPQAYRQLHTLLAHSADSKRQALRCSQGEQWKHELWRAETLVWVYHHLAADPHTHWTKIMDVLILAIRKRRQFAFEIIETLAQEDISDELTQSQRQMVQLIKQQLQAIEHGALKDGLEMFEALCHLINLSPQAKGYAFAYRGECFRQIGQWERALQDFQEALNRNPQDSWAIASRGETYRRMEQYEEALADFDRAIALNEKYSWAIASRGATYQALRRYEEALADFDRAIALNEKYDWAIASRGEMYRLMGRYEEALADFDRAIALNEDYSWAIASRGMTYRLMKRYEEALADFDRAIALDENYGWVIARRGETYRLMGRYEEALADLDRAIALDEKYSGAIANRGAIYLLMKRYEEALADFDRAIALDENYGWVITSRGITYELMKRYEEALADFDRAIALNEKYGWAIAHRGQIYRLMGRYEEALLDFDRAIALDEKYDWHRYCRAQLYLLTGQTQASFDEIHTAIALAQEALQVTHDRMAAEAYRLRFDLALYLLFAGQEVEAEALYGELLSTCSDKIRLRNVIDDLCDFLTVQPNHPVALRLCTLLQASIDKML